MNQRDAHIEKLIQKSIEKSSSFQTSRWMVDKKIPMALIAAVIFQTVMITWGAATLSSDVKNQGNAIQEINTSLKQLDHNVGIKLDTKLDRNTAAREVDSLEHRIDLLETRVRTLEQQTAKYTQRR